MMLLLAEGEWKVRDEKELIRDVQQELADVEGNVNKLKSQCEHGECAHMREREGREAGSQGVRETIGNYPVREYGCAEGECVGLGVSRTFCEHFCGRYSLLCVLNVLNVLFFLVFLFSIVLGQHVPHAHACVCACVCVAGPHLTCVL